MAGQKYWTRCATAFHSTKRKRSWTATRKCNKKAHDNDQRKNMRVHTTLQQLYYCIIIIICNIRHIYNRYYIEMVCECDVYYWCAWCAISRRRSVRASGAKTKQLTNEHKTTRAPQWEILSDRRWRRLATGWRRGTRWREPLPVFHWWMRGVRWARARTGALRVTRNVNNRRRRRSERRMTCCCRYRRSWVLHQPLRRNGTLTIDSACEWELLSSSTPPPTHRLCIPPPQTIGTLEVERRRSTAVVLLRRS